MSRRMQPRQLKRLIETGHYRPEPADVAEAMLRRRGVRQLLSGAAAGADGDGQGWISRDGAGRIQSPSASRRQAA